MAYQIPVFSHTFAAGEDLSSAQFKFVKLNAAGQVIACTAATDVPVGVLQNNPASGGAAEVMLVGITKVQGDANLARGNQVGTSADGQAAAYVPGTNTTSYIVGQVLDDNNAVGGLATITLNCLNPHRAA